jgi:hypothetical protein
MRAFEVSLNDKKLCLVGVERGVLTAMVTQVARERGEELSLDVGGLANDEHLKWITQKLLRVGDEIRVKIVGAASVDEPIHRQKSDPAQRLTAKKHSVRAMAKEFGWKIQTQSKRRH